MPNRSLLVSLLLIATLTDTTLGQDAQQDSWLVVGTPDPAVIEAHDGTGYYIYSTGKGISIWHSRNLKDWRHRGRVFDDPVPAWAAKRIPGSDSIWAPDISRVAGRYYLYYSVSTFGSQRSAIGLAVNVTLDPQSPAYHWEDRGLVIESSPERNDYNAIDPALFVDDDGRAFLFWGSYWTGIKAVEVDPSTGKPTSSQPNATPVAARRDKASTAIEGPYVIKRNGFYYLFVSWDFCCARENSTYKVMVGRSSAPLGPYVDRAGQKMTDGAATLLLMGDRRWRGPGHNSVLQTAEGDWLVHHVIDTTTRRKGRILQMRPLKWKDDWPVVGDPLTGPPASETQSQPLVGRWNHVVNDRDRFDIFLEPNGFVTGTGGDAFWEQTGDDLLLKWKAPDAPGGFWMDRLQLAPDQRHYQGTNQAGLSIHGERR